MRHSVEDSWNSAVLESLNQAQWEALCDGCGKCCLHRLEDEQSREIHFTNVSCRYLDSTTCRCTSYRSRFSMVPECVSVTAELLRDKPHWLPASCAYRLRAENRPLPGWHPLISGDHRSVIDSGNSVSGRVINELEVEDLQHHIVDWIR